MHIKMAGSKIVLDGLHQRMATTSRTHKLWYAWTISTTVFLVWLGFGT